MAPEKKQNPGRPPWHFTVVFLLLCAGVGGVGTYLVAHERADLLREKRESLRFIAETKARQVEEWREERLEDGKFFHASAAFRALVERTMRTPPGSDVRGELADWLVPLQRHHDYGGIFLLSPRGAPLYQTGGSTLRLLPEEIVLPAQWAPGDNVRMTEIHRPVPNALHCIDMTVPIVSRDGHTLTALLLFRIDPRLLLFPLVQSWPLPSVSSEALLVRSDGDSLLYLNEARHLLSAAGVLRGALRTPRLAATAASRGANASFEGPDYRGHEVLAAAHPVEGTGWTLLAKTDRDEVLASFDRRVGIVLLLLAILLGLSAVGFGLVWRMHRMEDDLTLRTAETLQDAILNSLTLNIAVLNDRGIIVSVNESWRRFALENGCRDTGAIGVGANYLTVCEAAIAGGGEGEARSALEGIRGVLERRLEGFQLEYPCHSPEEQRWFEMRVSRLEAPGTGVVVAHETITGRKRAAAEQQALLDMLRRLSSRLESAREEERAHIAREVHDEFGQALTAMKMDLQDIRTRGGSLESAVLRRLRSMEELIDRSVVTVQRLASELRPPMLDELGLLAAAEWYVQDVVDRSGIVCVRERMDAPPPSDRPRVTALYRVLQEALTNILRHAGATEIRLSLEYSSGKVILKVRDNGRGITTGELSSMQSLGVLGMRERLQAHGGELVIRGSPGQGTLVVARLPWPTADPVSFRP